jgi:hypothetical protein
MSIEPPMGGAASLRYGSIYANQKGNGMEDTTGVEGCALAAALELAEAGYKLVPIPRGFKYPKGFGRWQEIATNDADTITGWLDGNDHGIGLAMGEQPNGKHLFAVDVDGDEGMDVLIGLLGEHGGQDTFLNTANQNTGNNGAHFIFEAPFEVRNSAKRFADHIDVRGEGGQIVVGPSIHPNGNPYVWNRLLANHPPLAAPGWVMDRIAEMCAEDPQPTLAPVPAKRNVESDVPPLEWFNTMSAYSVLGGLQRLGWQLGRRRGDEQQLVRPGKDGREGTSATFHCESGLLNIYSTSVDPLYEQVGLRRQGCITLKPVDVWMVENGITDRSRASSEIRKMMPQVPRETSIASLVAHRPPAEGGTAGDREPGSTVPGGTGLNLSDEFWEQREWLRAVRQAAHNRLISADAVLGALITRFATVIPPQYRIPPIVGAHSTFDHISVIVGQSGAGKSAAMAVARELYLGPQQRKDIVWDIPVPSGEGLVSKYFELVTEERDGKKVLVNTKTKTAVHFSIDEAMSLVSAGKGRTGATIGSVLCTAWSGGDPGQSNASGDRDRQGMKPFTFRMAGLAGVQMALGHHLLDETWVNQGLSGRLVFFAGEDPCVPDPHTDDIPDFPDRLDFEVPPTLNIELTYDAQIVSEVRKAHWLRTTGQVIEDAVDGHQRLIRLKLSGIMALMDGRTHVSASDWELAEQIQSSSRRIRSVMMEHRRQQDRDEGHRRAEAQGYYQEVAAEAAREQRVERCKKAIVRALAKHGPMDRAGVKNKLDGELVKSGVLSDALDGLEASEVIHRQKGEIRLV